MYSAPGYGIALPGILALQGLLTCSYFVPNQSYPDQRQFFFAYSVTISNEGIDTVQLLNRHWVIHNAEGQKQEVRQAQVHLSPIDIAATRHVCFSRRTHLAFIGM